jgi:2-polyprenyl-6-methoxyphenol hydroxylase-like FAD-dependent oxidoreductase
MYMEGESSDFKELLIEAVPDGWWYTHEVPNVRRVVVCMTDPDIGHDRGLRTLNGWVTALAETLFIARAAEGSTPIGMPQLWPAGTRHLATVSHPSLLCVGDSAACFDPIFGQGIIKSIRSGILASYAIADRITRADDRGIQRFHAFNLREFQSYRRTTAEHYRYERRWPNHEFWRCRHQELG